MANADYYLVPSFKKATTSLPYLPKDVLLALGPSYLSLYILVRMLARDFTLLNSDNFLYLKEVGLLELGIKVATLTLAW
jgi:hypothetical protein